MTGRARVRLVVTGRVQGVAFRQATADEARRLGGVAGWVRNLPDGSVEVVAEGERGSLEALARYCGRGPRLAQVEDVRVEWEPVRGGLGPFDIAF